MFSAPPGALFSQRNIANQFKPNDNNAISVLSYGVQSLGVGHIIVMGHYGCGGVRAAMLPKPNTTNDFSGHSVQSWINPIRHTYWNSSRPEICLYREANKNKTTVDPPAIDNPAFRALVEENVKETVFNVAISPSMRQHWAAYTAQEKAGTAPLLLLNVVLTLALPSSRFTSTVSSTIPQLGTSSISELQSVRTGPLPRLPPSKPSSAPSTNTLMTIPTCEFTHQLIPKKVTHTLSLSLSLTILGATRRGLNETSRKLFLSMLSPSARGFDLLGRWFSY